MLLSQSHHTPSAFGRNAFAVGGLKVRVVVLFWQSAELSFSIGRPTVHVTAVQDVVWVLLTEAFRLFGRQYADSLARTALLPARSSEQLFVLGVELAKLDLAGRF